MAAVMANLPTQELNRIKRFTKPTSDNDYGEKPPVAAKSAILPLARDGQNAWPTENWKPSV
jgi:hypothetical protein